MKDSKAVLCVDNEQIVLRSLRDQILKHFGDRYYYESAESAEEAWEVIHDLHAQGLHILVIVSDRLIPDVEGNEFLVRVHQRFPQIVKVLLTGYADEAAIARMRTEANLHTLLMKPWREEVLINTIDAGLGTDHG